MRPLRRIRTTLYIASLAMWFAALAPAFSAAVQPGGWADRRDVCSTLMGAALAESAATLLAGASGADGDRGSKVPAADLSSCGYCLLAAHWAPPPGVAALAPPTESAALMAEPSVGLPPAGPGWLLLPSRAPPVRG